MPVPRQFDGTARAELRDALIDAFPAPFDFRDFLLDRQNKQFFQLVPLALPYSNQLTGLLTNANAQVWIADLTSAALDVVPNNPKLRAFAEQYGFAAVTAQVREDAHQRMVQAGVPYLDPDIFRTRLGVLEQQVCRIEVNLDQGSVVYGTGFLLGPSVVMTNYHVLESVFAGSKGQMTKDGYSAKPQNVALRFDFKRLAEGTLNPGVVHTLAANWDLDSSASFSPVDGNAPVDQLDYALIRLSEKAGNQPAGKKGAATGSPRSWMTPRVPYPFATDSPIFILQHPKGDALKLAIATKGVIGTTGNATRVRYNTNTEAGSSGSPCFTQDLELVALHHAGDPNFEHVAAWNQGIPFGTILSLMRQRGTDVLLGT